MSFDSMTMGIVAALISASIFIVIEVIRKKDIDVRNSIVMFSAVYAVFQGYQLIETAVMGNPDNLPETWRIYVGLTGLIVIGLSLQYILKIFSKVMERSAKEEKQIK
uniref:Uncharacterized protein n=1 Tax=Candidatus Kentrum sp. FW TaxID=2126338 RepID=A0A450TIQ7_9GAMM|nr:MAG: hypothetical protein BECKFW1821B_GA0114236_112612 [Candidatus Kentron sp. FW]